MRLDTPSKLVLLAGVLAIVLILPLPPEDAKRWTRENGVVENTSVVFLTGSTALCIERLVVTPSRRWLSGSLVTLVLLLRELDFHRRFTERSLDSTGFHRSPDIPLRTKLIAVGAGLPFLAAALHVGWLGLRQLPAAWRAREPWVTYAVLGLSMIPVARYAEKSGRDPLDVFEEVAEAVFAAFVLLAVWYLRRRG